MRLELTEWLQEENDGSSFLHAVLRCNRGTAGMLREKDISVTLKLEYGHWR